MGKLRDYIFNGCSIRINKINVTDRIYHYIPNRFKQCI